MNAPTPKSGPLQEGRARVEAIDGPLFHLVLNTARLLEALLRSELEPHGLHHGQGRIMDALLDHESGLTQVQMAQMLGIRETAATQVVRRLEDLRLVVREPDPSDARAFRVTLTGSGKRAARHVRAAWSRAESRLVSGLSPPVAEDARRVLILLRDAMGGRDPDVSITPSIKKRS